MAKRKDRKRKSQRERWEGVENRKKDKNEERGDEQKKDKELSKKNRKKKIKGKEVRLRWGHKIRFPT